MKRSYSLLVMSSQGEVRQMRMSRAMLRFLLLLCVILPLLTAFLLWGGWKLCEVNLSLRERQAALQGEVEKYKELAARLGSLEQFLYENDPELLKMVLGPALMAERFPPKNTAPEAVSPEKPSQEAAGQAPAPELPEEGGVKPEAVTEAQSGADEPARVEELDLGVVELKNIKARMAGSRSMRVSFDLYNKKAEGVLSGTVELFLCLKDGTVLPLNESDETSFRINRLRKMVNNPLLPDIMELEDSRVLIKIFVKDELVFAGFHDLQR